MNPQVLALLSIPLFAASAFADMGAPLHTRVPARTTVTLEKPIPGYVYYAYGDGYAVRLPLDPAITVELPHLASRMLLLAVPVAVADRFPTAEVLANELVKKMPDGVRAYEFAAFFDEFPLDTYRDDELRIAIRNTPSGIEFVKVHTPKATGSCWVMLAAVGWTVLAVLFGIRWARRRRA